MTNTNEQAAVLASRCIDNLELVEMIMSRIVALDPELASDSDLLGADRVNRALVRAAYAVGAIDSREAARRGVTSL